jgi:ankyrin repeat protein
MAVFTFDADTAIVRRLLDAGANPNVVDRTGTTPLLRAAIAKDTAVFRVLVAKGADPCSKDENGKTVLDYAGVEFPVLQRMATAAFQRCRAASR